MHPRTSAKTTPLPSPRCPMIIALAGILLLGVSTFSSAAAFSSRGRSPSPSTLSTNGSAPGSFAFRRPVLMVPRGGDTDSERGRASGSVDASESEQEPSTTESATTTTATSNGRPSSSARSRRFAAVSPLAALRPVASLYCAALARNPIATNCATAAALSVTSDAIAQRVERRGAVAGSAIKHDVSRTAWMALWGFLVSGLMIHYWFIFLNGLFPVEGLTLGGALKKVAVNQLVMSPGLNGLFFTFTTYTRGDVVGGDRAVFLRRKLAADLLPTIQRSCVYWGAVQLVNFMLVPPRFAILYTNVGFLIWTTYISLVGYRTVAVAGKR